MSFATGVTDGISEEDRRKADNKAKKAAAKAKAAAEEAKKLASKGGKTADAEEEVAKDVDSDPLGEKLWETTKPLEEIEGFVERLEALGETSLEALSLVSEAALAKGNVDVMFMICCFLRIADCIFTDYQAKLHAPLKHFDRCTLSVQVARHSTCSSYAPVSQCRRRKLSCLPELPMSYNRNWRNYYRPPLSLWKITILSSCSNIPTIQRRTWPWRERSGTLRSAKMQMACSNWYVKQCDLRLGLPSTYV